MTKNIDSDQTIPCGAVWSGSALFLLDQSIFILSLFKVYNILNTIWNIVRRKYFDTASNGKINPSSRLVALGLTALWDSVLVYIGLFPREERKKREMIDERKNVQTTPPAPSASEVGPRPTLIQISRTLWHWKFIQHHRTTDHPSSMFETL